MSLKKLDVLHKRIEAYYNGFYPSRPMVFFQSTNDYFCYITPNGAIYEYVTPKFKFFAHKDVESKRFSVMDPNGDLFPTLHPQFRDYIRVDYETKWVFEEILNAVSSGRVIPKGDVRGSVIYPTQAYDLHLAQITPKQTSWWTDLFNLGQSASSMLEMYGSLLFRGVCLAIFFCILIILLLRLTFYLLKMKKNPTPTYKTMIHYRDRVVFYLQLLFELFRQPLLMLWENPTGRWILSVLLLIIIQTLIIYIFGLYNCYK